MKTILLGQTQEHVSALCLGAMNMRSRIADAVSFSLLDAYYEAGGRFIDTANCYTAWVEGGQGGDSELLLGEWMRSRGNSKSLFISTKVGIGYKDRVNEPGSGTEGGLSAREIQTECEKSLKRLGVDTIDLYYTHRDDRQIALEESLPALNQLVKDGKVRHLGTSNMLPWRIQEARMLCHSNQWTSYCCTQYRYSCLRQNPQGSYSQHLYVNRDMLDYCSANKFPIIAFSPLMKGGLTNPSRLWGHVSGPDAEARIAVLGQIAAEKNATINQLALAWLMHRKDVTVIPLFSASSLKQMKENLGAVNLVLSDEEFSRIDQAGN